MIDEKLAARFSTRMPTLDNNPVTPEHVAESLALLREATQGLKVIAGIALKDAEVE